MYARMTGSEPRSRSINSEIHCLVDDSCSSTSHVSPLEVDGDTLCSLAGFGRREVRSFGRVEVGVVALDRRNLGSHEVVS